MKRLYLAAEIVSWSLAVARALFFVLAIVASAVHAGPGECAYLMDTGSDGYGSGMAVGDRWIATCAHLFRKVNTVHAMRSDVTIPGVVVAMDPHTDTALVYLDAPVAEWVEVADRDPAPGSTVTLFGFGTGRRLCATTGRVRTLSSLYIETSITCEQGDSGGGLVDEHGRLVGIQSVSLDREPPGPAGCARISAFHKTCEYYETQCGPGGCQLPWRGNIITRPLVNVQPQLNILSPRTPYNGQQAQQQPRPQPGPAPQPAPRPIAQPNSQLPANQPKCECDLSSILTRLDAQQQHLHDLTEALQKASSTPPVSGEPGPTGPRGPAGPPGKDASCDCDPDQIKADLIAMVDARLAKIKFPAPAPPIINAKRHIVIVADRKADSWPRLSDDIERAKHAYSGIRIADPPDFSVPLPQIVAYENGIPVKVIQGSREVSNALAHVARGDFSLFQGAQ